MYKPATRRAGDWGEMNSFYLGPSGSPFINTSLQIVEKGPEQIVVSQLDSRLGSADMQAKGCKDIENANRHYAFIALAKTKPFSTLVIR